MDVALGVLLFVSLATTHASGDGSHVRTMDPRLRHVIADGMKRSPAFRALVAQLDASDVIVYAERECMLPPGLVGRLAFMSSVGERRFVNVRISCTLAGTQQIASLGHELRHAVEIASAPSVIDEATMAAEYSRIGFPSRAVSRGFDSRAAIEAGERIALELSNFTAQTR